jgi:hypothetical protein
LHNHTKQPIPSVTLLEVFTFQKNKLKEIAILLIFYIVVLSEIGETSEVPFSLN